MLTSSLTRRGDAKAGPDFKFKFGFAWPDGEGYLYQIPSCSTQASISQHRLRDRHSYSF